MTWDGVGYPGRSRGRKSPESPTSRVIAEIGKPTPGLNPLSPYFSGLNWGRVGITGIASSAKLETEIHSRGRLCHTRDRKRKVARKRNELASPSCEIV